MQALQAKTNQPIQPPRWLFKKSKMVKREKSWIIPFTRKSDVFWNWLQYRQRGLDIYEDPLGKWKGGKERGGHYKVKSSKTWRQPELELDGKSAENIWKPTTHL